MTHDNEHKKLKRENQTKTNELIKSEKNGHKIRKISRAGEG